MRFSDVFSRSVVVELSGKKPWMVKIGAIFAVLCHYADCTALMHYLPTHLQLQYGGTIQAVKYT